MNLRVSYSDMLYFVRWAWARSDLKCRSQIFVVVVVVVVVVVDGLPHLLHLQTQTMLEQNSVAQLRPPFRGLAWVQAVPGSCRFPAHGLLCPH